jgi:pimeloyl-ACP methyl ester carboxylesterase
METFVLVHGAWADASAWDGVSPLLKARGYDVISVNLPGHGKDNTPYAGISLTAYVDAVKKAIGKNTNVILVGHSLGGLIISQVAEQIPAQIKRLVYLAAFVPKNGDQLLSLSQQDTGSHLGKYLQVNQNEGYAVIAKEGFMDVFAADAPPSIADYLLAGLRPEPLAPFAAPAALTDANFGKIEKTYIYTINDHAISYAFQQKMVKSSNVTREYALPASHTPFITMPGILAAIFLQEAK